MTDWQFYDSSKWGAKCCYCSKAIPLSDPRWVAKKETGKGRFNACVTCIPAPEENMQPPEKPSSVPSTPSTEAKPPNTYDPQSRIAKAHDDNMLSAELTRNAITMLTKSIDALTNAMNARTHILEEQIKKGG